MGHGGSVPVCSGAVDGGYSDHRWCVQAGQVYSPGAASGDAGLCKRPGDCDFSGAIAAASGGKWGWLSGEWYSGTKLYVMMGLIALTMAITINLPKLTKAVPSALAAIFTVTVIALGLDWIP